MRAPVAPGFLVVDKPVGVTSHDVVGMVRAVTGVRKVGHTGTLDPFATGVLPLALGHATRLIQYLDESLKVYDATLALGQRTDTGDHTGEVVAEAPVPSLSEERVAPVLAGLVGEREQVPPRYSAVKVAGKPLYKYARAGEEVEVRARLVRIDAVELISLESDRLRVRIRCGRGTYARVLAEELGQALGTEAHLVALRRERSGPFTLEGALSLPELAGLVGEVEGEDWRAVLRPGRGAERVPWRPREEVAAGLAERLRPPRVALDHLPAVQLGVELRPRFRHGGPPPLPPAGAPEGGRYLVLDGEELVAIAELRGGRPKTCWRAPTGT